MTSYGAGAVNVRFNIDDDHAIPIARSVDQLLPLPTTSRRSAMVQPEANAQTSRRPYIYSVPRNISQVSFQSGTAVESTPTTTEEYRDHNMALRYRLYTRLDPGGSHLLMPAHVIPSEMFSILPFDDFKDIEGKQSSVVTIFSIWNTMMGTSVLAMPWALQQSGLILGLFLMLFIAAIAFYTAYRVVESPKSLSLPVDTANAEFSDVCRYFWGKSGEYTSVFFSIVVLFGGVIVYFVLMTNFLYYSGNIIYESLQPNSTILPIMANKTFTCDIYCPEEFEEPSELLSDILTHGPFNSWDDERTNWNFTDFWKLQGGVPIVLALALFPLLNFKSPTFFMKFNVLGTISVVFLICFTISKAIECHVNVNFYDRASEHFIKLFNINFPALTGTLALSYFIHNAILTILKNQKHPENNPRDLCIGYVLSSCSYILVGMLFFLAFPINRSCIADNFLNNFGTGDVLSATARVFLLFQMLTVLPLLLYLIRVQFSYVFAGTVYPGLFYVVLINVGVLTVAAFFAVVYPHIGSIIRYVGFVYIFTLPCLVHLKRLQYQNRLTTIQIVIHAVIIILGLLNVILQFFVN